MKILELPSDVTKSVFKEKDLSSYVQDALEEQTEDRKPSIAAVEMI